MPVDVPFVVDIDTDIPPQLIELCSQVLTFPSTHSCEVVQVQGGITNLLFRVTPEGLDPVLVRIFGKAGDLACDRQSENAIFLELAASGFGPALWGLFGNGRIEGWLVGRRPMEAVEMLQTEPVDFVGKTAVRLAEMHRLSPDAAGDSSLPRVWEQLAEWIVHAGMVRFPPGSEKAALLEDLHLQEIFAEARNLEATIPSSRNEQGQQLIDSSSGVLARAREVLYEVAFCHNDLLSGNMMYSQEKDDLVFIDFEYASYNCVGFDIANHFNAVPESCLILDNTFDAKQYYPSRKVRHHWLRSYLAARGVDGVDQDFLDACSQVILEFSLLAEIRWVIWAVLNAGHAAVDFDYLNYAKLRYCDGFLVYKEWWASGRFARSGG
uniref:ethanolamine kinase n=1 Tax=Noctiluca scintillans TaxID=2966 RepID=A0A7S1F289_NOCSC